MNRPSENGYETTTDYVAALEKWAYQEGREAAAGLLDQNDRLRELIEDAQWYEPYSNSSASCPWCLNQQFQGHESDCPALAVLRGSGAEEAARNE